MQTKAQKRKKELLRKKYQKILKILSIIVLILSGFIYWYNNSDIDLPENGSAEFSTSKKNTEVSGIPDKSKNITLTPEITDDPVKDNAAAENPKTIEITATETTLTEEAVREKVLYDDLGRLNINEAGIEELCKLKGIGEKRAKDIIEYREACGGFKTIEDIMKVKGIKQGIFSKIKDYIFCD